MPPRPFGFNVGIGTDIVHIPRIRQLLQRQKSRKEVKAPRGPQQFENSLTRFLQRVLTLREQADFWAKFNIRDRVRHGQNTDIERYLAGRWAAKEAVIKAVRYRRLRLMDIEILRYPRVQGRGGVFALILDEPSASHSHLSTRLDQTPEVEISSANASTVSQNDPQKFATPCEDSRKAQDEAMDDEEDFLASGSRYGKLKGQIARISISHDGEYATAVCLAADEAMPGDVGGEAMARMP